MPMQTDYSYAPAVAVEGQLACRYADAEIDSSYNGDVVAINWGRGVEWASGTDDKAVKLPNVETDKIKGITVRSHSIAPDPRGELDDANGVKVGGQLNVLVEGEIWVKVHTGCAPGDRLWVRAVVNGAGTFLGGCENADDGTNMIDCTAKGSFRTFAAADGLAKLRVDFT